MSCCHCFPPAVDLSTRRLRRLLSAEKPWRRACVVNNTELFLLRAMHRESFRRAACVPCFTSERSNDAPMRTRYPISWLASTKRGRRKR